MDGIVKQPNNIDLLTCLVHKMMSPIWIFSEELHPDLAVL